MAIVRMIALLLVSLALAQGRRMLQDDNQVDAVRLNARSAQQAAALARAGIAVQPEVANIAPAPGYEDVQSPSQAPLPSPASEAEKGTLLIGTPEPAPAPADTITEVPQRNFDDLGTMVVSLPIYPADGYGL